MSSSSYSPRVRSAVTLLVLLALFLGGVWWGWTKLTKPFPEPQEAAGCTETTVRAGDRIHPGQVMVSVFNASDQGGLASDTMTALVNLGFGEGKATNAPDEVTVRKSAIIAEDPKDPRVRLVRSYLGKGSQIIAGEPGAPGINVVVGQKFDKIVTKRALKSVGAKSDIVICDPPDPEEEVEEEPRL